jgi:hypothetical protein
LEGLEAHLSTVRHTEADDWGDGWQRRRAKKRRADKIEALQAEIAEAEIRLRVLLSEGRGKVLGL